MTKIDLDELESKARAARPGPWQWYGNTKTYDVQLATVHGGRVFVMDFVRWGMAGAQPRFQIDHRMHTLGELGLGEHPMGPQFEVPYRRQFLGIGHPDAQHIAANDPSTTLALIARIRELETGNCLAIERAVDAALGEVSRQQGGIAGTIAREARSDGVVAGKTYLNALFEKGDL